MTCRIAVLLPALCLTAAAADLDLAKKSRDTDARWASFENLAARKGQGGGENRGAKGHAFDSLKPGETKVLLDAKGSGAIRRMWFTVRERDPQMLRSLRLEMFWDGAPTPAVSVPFGDFFAAILGRPVAFENELFSNPEGRSFNSYIPMPFRKAARVTLTNDSGRHVPYVFYDIDFTLTAKPDDGLLYFHSCWRRERWTELGKDFEILPKVRGEGRFLGAHVGVITHPDNIGWWGEGEVKMYLDGDTELPTIAGTGTEDYIGTGWGQGVYHNRFQGSMVADERTGQYGFYRYHIPDPVYFHKEARVTIQQMGGAPKDKIIELLKKGVAVKPVSIDDNGRFLKLLEMPPAPLESIPTSPTAWTNVYRRDDWSAVALFYLDSPENGLPGIAPAGKRTEGLAAPN